MGFDAMLLAVVIPPFAVCPVHVIPLVLVAIY